MSDDMNRPPTPIEIDTSNRPSMGDPEFVTGQVKQMLDEDRAMLLAAPEGSNPQVAIKALVAKWADQFYSGNDAYVQTLTPDAQRVWLQEHGLGNEDSDPKGPVTALVAETLKRFNAAVIPFAEQEIDEEQCKFRIDTAIEDCVALLLGIENPAD